MKNALSRYFKIIEGKTKAKFLIAKKIPVDFNKNESEKALWKKHSKAIKCFYSLQRNLGFGKIKFENLKETKKKGLLDLKIEIAKRITSPCELCERKCGAERSKDKKGACGVGKESRISSIFQHLGEEYPDISPSLTIFFLGCPFFCVFCQNYTLSRSLETGEIIDPKELAKILEKYNRNVKNLNWVGADPVPHLCTILKTYKYYNINLACVWNSNMFMSEKTMKLLEGIVDLYLADFKYGCNETALKYSKVNNYWETITRNFLIAKKHSEVLIRILVLPNDWLKTDYPKILDWIKKNLGKDTRLNIMDQFRPCYQAYEYPEINRILTTKEYEYAVNYAKKIGLKNLIA